MLNPNISSGSMGSNICALLPKRDEPPKVLNGLDSLDHFEANPPRFEVGLGHH